MRMNHSDVVSASLNESPSEKEGKLLRRALRRFPRFRSLNESPSEKEGKFGENIVHTAHLFALNESPSEKEGKY